MPSPGDLAVTVEVVPDEITAENVRASLAARMVLAAGSGRS
jgi:hypothetical protein